eukprot:495188_1
MALNNLLTSTVVFITSIAGVCCIMENWVFPADSQDDSHPLRPNILSNYQSDMDIYNHMDNYNHMDIYNQSDTDIPSYPYEATPKSHTYSYAAPANPSQNPPNSYPQPQSNPYTAPQNPPYSYKPQQNPSNSYVPPPKPHHTQSQSNPSYSYTQPPPNPPLISIKTEPTFTNSVSRRLFQSVDNFGSFNNGYSRKTVKNRRKKRRSKVKTEPNNNNFINGQSRSPILNDYFFQTLQDNTGTDGLGTIEIFDSDEDNDLQLDGIDEKGNNDGTPIGLPALQPEPNTPHHVSQTPVIAQNNNQTPIQTQLTQDDSAPRELRASRASDSNPSPIQTQLTQDDSAPRELIASRSSDSDSDISVIHLSPHNSNINVDATQSQTSNNSTQLSQDDVKLSQDDVIVNNNYDDATQPSQDDEMVYDNDMSYQNNGVRERGQQYGKLVQYKTSVLFSDINWDMVVNSTNTKWGYRFQTDDLCAQGILLMKSRQSYITRFQNLFNDQEIEICSITKKDVADVHFVEQNKTDFFKWHNGVFMDGIKLDAVSLDVQIKHVRELVINEGIKEWSDICRLHPTWAVQTKLESAFDAVIDEVQRKEKKKTDDMLYANAVLRPFQQILFDEWKEAVLNPMETDFRQIELIEDQVGNSGKSWLTSYMEYVYGRGTVMTIETLSEVKNLAELLRKNRNIRLLLVDLPKSTKFTKKMDCMSFFENVKNRSATLTKYKCAHVGLTYIVKVVILCNWSASPWWWSEDRYYCRRIVRNDNGDLELQDVEIDFTEVNNQSSNY